MQTSELKDLFRKLGHEVSDEEIKEIVDEYDADGNGQIDFSEFLDMMSRQMQGASRSEFLTEAFKVRGGAPPHAAGCACASPCERAST